VLLDTASDHSVDRCVLSRDLVLPKLSVPIESLVPFDWIFDLPTLMHDDLRKTPNARRSRRPRTADLQRFVKSGTCAV
jgi:hypothetical protein